MDALVWALRALRDYEGRVASLGVLSTVEVALRVLLPWPMKAVVDHALGSVPAPAWLLILPPALTGTRPALLVTIVVVGILLQLAHQAVLTAHTGLYARTAQLMIRDMRQRLFMHLQGPTLRHHSRTPVGESVYQLQADAAFPEHLLLRGLLPLAFSTVTLVVMFGIEGALTVGTLLVALAYLGFVYGPLSGIATTTGAIQQALASAARVRQTMVLVPERMEDGALDPPRPAGRVVFEHVSFGYDTRPVLQDISFAVEPGEMVALVGPSGSGKTTLVSLLPRFYEPDSGRILIDGVDAARYSLRALRQHVAIVLQEAVVLSGSIRENLRYGRLDATDADIEAAARAAHAHDFIMALGGYDTALPAAGDGLSGGQRQRLSLARAFLKDAPILVLDEPTAALDAISERLVFSAVRRLREGRTMFVIAHRLSTVRGADRILVLSAGRLVAEGKHESLLRDSPLYRELAAQMNEPPGEGPDRPEAGG